MRGERGQAVVEWLALLALVTLLSGTAIAVADATFLGRRITREMARALCIVRLGDCRRDQEACAVRADERRSDGTITASFFRRTEGGMTLIERLSDGTIRVTRSSGDSWGVAVGGQLGLDGAVGSLVVGAEASTDKRKDEGRSWIVPGGPGAAERVERLAGGGAAPEPDVVFRELGHDTNLKGSLTFRLLDDLLGDAEASARHLRRAGELVDRRTGHRTVYVAAPVQGEARGVLGGVLGGSVSAGRRVGETYAIEYDADGRPLDLRITGVSPYETASDLPAVLGEVGGMLDVRAAPGRSRLLEVTGHLDLTIDDNRAAAGRALAALGGKGVRIRPGAAEALAALRERVLSAGTIEARVLERAAWVEDTGSKAEWLSDLVGKADELLGRVAFGVRIPRVPRYDRVQEAGVTRLLAAASRGLDGQWLPRVDCVPRV